MAAKTATAVKKVRELTEEEILKAPEKDYMNEAQLAFFKKKLIELTSDAVARGAFGSPTFFVGEEMFFGKDQLRDVEESIVEQTSRVAAKVS